jgi:hypothetical protein
MPKGDTHVKKHSKGGKRIYVSNDLKIPNESEGEMIGVIIGTLGSCRFSVGVVNENIEVQASAPRSFSAGPNKEIIKVKDYVIIQPGISKNQYFINHKYSEAEVQKLYDLKHIGKPKQSVTVDESDIIDEPNEEQGEELQLDDIWDI